MRRSIRNRDIAFRHEDGRSYTHRCTLEVYEQVAWVLEQAPHEGWGLAINEIAAAHDLPHTQVDVTLAFLLERSIIDRRHRRNYPATDSVRLDAMVEWHALREEPSLA